MPQSPSRSTKKGAAMSNISLVKSSGMNSMDDNKSKALAAALAQIEKQFGKGSIMKMGEAQVQNDLSVVSTGSLGLDIALGVGARPRGGGLWAGVLRKDDARAAGRGAGAEGGGRRRLHRRGERARSHVRGKARRQRRRDADLAA